MRSLASTSKLNSSVVTVAFMDTNKIREMITELQAEIDQRVQAVKALERILLSSSTSSEKLNGMKDSVQQPVLFGTSDSYIDIAVKTIEANGGKPVPVGQIVDRIRTLKGNPNIERRSVEASLYNHVKSKKEQSRIIKSSPGVYTIRRFPRTVESVA